jgi:hypothetical protein
MTILGSQSLPMLLTTILSTISKKKCRFFFYLDYIFVCFFMPGSFKRNLLLFLNGQIRSNAQFCDDCVCRSVRVVYARADIQNAKIDWYWQKVSMSKADPIKYDSRRDTVDTGRGCTNLFLKSLSHFSKSVLDKNATQSFTCLNH